MRPGPARGLRRERRETCAQAAAPRGWGWVRDETAPRVGAQDGVIGFAGVRDTHVGSQRAEPSRGVSHRTGAWEARPAWAAEPGVHPEARDSRGACVYSLFRHSTSVLCANLRQLLPWVLGTRQGVAPAPLRLRGATRCRGGGGCGPVQGEVGSGQGSLGS